ITVRNKEKIQHLYQFTSQDASAEPVEWVTFDPETLRATVQGLPGPSDISLPVDVNIVIEFMSR
ncbi:MAG: 30S ribosomal protein S4, partial [Pirellulaceae bacterium]|nr:30S ribosomal protein S4 [Pirellulaceae bacterium]